MNWLQFLIKKYCKKDPPQRNLTANILKRTFGPIFEPPYLKAAVGDIFASLNYKLLKTNSF